ncbi:MAG: hypothetical protein B7Z15_15785 [Rhizobiales bacterium 32-66-8]|nr:MAG: hypothetical protein B7Z15_15785 [Rhizobiales bacterium 32-66-8]
MDIHRYGGGRVEFQRDVATGAGDLVARYRQGHGPAALLTLYKTSLVQLSTNSGARPGGYGHQQHVLDLRFASHPMARSWINHPGESDPWGQRRPSYWAGNGNLPRVGQNRHIAMLLYRLDADEPMGFTHVFAARSGVEHHLRGDTLILRAGAALAAYKATGPLEAVLTGPGAGIEYRSHGREQGWATIVGKGTTDVEGFADYVARCRLGLDQDGTRLVLTPPDGAAYGLDWSQGLSVGGTPVPTGAMSSDPSVEFVDRSVV